MTKRVGELEENITRVETEDGVSAGIRWRSFGEGMVPIFEEHLARSEKKYTLEEWYALDLMDRAMTVAIRRIDNASKNHQAQAEIKASKAKQRK